MFRPTVLNLVCHPASPAPAGLALQCSVRADAAGLSLFYQLLGDPAQLRWPEPASGCADGLWQRTCMEVFVAGQGEAGYREFNFSPSGQWAAYAFSDYRQRDPAWHAAVTPQHTAGCQAGAWQLQARIPAALLPSTPWRLGLSAVLEHADGALSYWALAHPGERPDFHHRASVCLDPDSGVFS